MGMYDNVKCLYPLPVEGANSLNYQTKGTEAQACLDYKITHRGLLYYKVPRGLLYYKVGSGGIFRRARWAWNDMKLGRSTRDKSLLNRLRGVCQYVCPEHYWVREKPADGYIEIYAIPAPGGWLSFLLLFKNGRVRKVEQRPS